MSQNGLGSYLKKMLQCAWRYCRCDVTTYGVKTCKLLEEMLECIRDLWNFTTEQECLGSDWKKMLHSITNVLEVTSGRYCTVAEYHDIMLENADPRTQLHPSKPKHIPKQIKSAKMTTAPPLQGCSHQKQAHIRLFVGLWFIFENLWPKEMLVRSICFITSSYSDGCLARDRSRKPTSCQMQWSSSRTQASRAGKSLWSDSSQRLPNAFQSLTTQF